MFSKHIDKINNLLSNVAQDSQGQADSIAIISHHMGRTTQTATIKKRSQSSTRNATSTSFIKSNIQVPEELEGVLKAIYKSKCNDMKIEVNKRSWELFLKTFSLRNKITMGEVAGSELDLANFSLGPSCVPHLNQLIELSTFTSINLTKNLIDPSCLTALTSLKEITLNNCKLGNDHLDTLFTLLLSSSSIEKLSLSSPQLKDRNQLTRYDKLTTLLKQSKTLITLNLSNIQIRPQNGIMEACKSSVLKHLDLSDNTSVKGISPSLISLNLSKNNIVQPFQLPLTPCLVQNLNLSYNKIPYYHFKGFLRNIYFPNITILTLDHLQLSGHITPIQQFIEQSLSLRQLSIVECDLSLDSFQHIANGVRFNRSLKKLDLSRNRVAYQKVAESLSLMLQGGTMTHLKMRHCDIKDHLGAIIFNNINKGKFIQSIDMMNNLLGDETAKTICRELRKAKNILELRLLQNIIKYKDKQQIQSYLVGNRHLSTATLQSQYRQLNQINKQEEESERKLRQEDEKYKILQDETDELEKTYYHMFLINNEEKKIKLLEEINKLREEETELQQELFIRETMLVPSLKLSQRESSLYNPEVINIPSPGRENRP